MATEKAVTDPAKKLAIAKRKLVTRLQREIIDVRANAETQIARIENRILVARALLQALESGTIKTKHLDRK